MKKLFLTLGLLGAILCSAVPTRAVNDSGVPESITDGNILHCFSWPLKDIIAELPTIAAAGFGSIQISPMQRPDIKEGDKWYDIYLPYDYHAFSSPGMGTREDLQKLCEEADKYGIKIIVDVVINHVNKTERYFNKWFQKPGRYRHWGNNGGELSIDYNRRYSITHDPLGDYVELNTENAEVIARAKAYMEELKKLGVKGIRFDAAKHIELPSETDNGDGVWPVVVSVPGLFYYGEIVGDCVNGNDKDIIEYSQYIWVPDKTYSTKGTQENGGIPYAPGGYRDEATGGKVIYWAESHDDYSNDEWSERLTQSVVDRDYCAIACRNKQSALYYSRPRARGKDNIKITKGSKAYLSKQVVEVNKFRNAMVGKLDYFSYDYNNGNDIACVTREKGGAVIVVKNGNSNINVENGGNYCPDGTYTDRVGGGTFRVANGRITGHVGPTGVAIIYDDSQTVNGGNQPATPKTVTITGTETYNVAYAGNFTVGDNYIYYWSSSSDNGPVEWPGVKMKRAKGDDGNYYWCYNVPAQYDMVIFHNNKGDFNMDLVNEAMRTANLPIDRKYIMDNGGATIVPVTFTTGSVPAEPTPQVKTVTIEGDYNIAYTGEFSHIHYWGGESDSTWPGVAMSTAQGDDGLTYKVFKVPAGTTGIIFNDGKDNTDNQTADLGRSSTHLMCESGELEALVYFKVNGEIIDPEEDLKPEELDVVWPADKYCYVVNQDNWSLIKIHIWNRTNGKDTPYTTWPGTTLSDIAAGKYIYKISSDLDPTHLLLNSKTSSTDNNGHQTADLSFENGATYYNNDGGHIGGNDNIEKNPAKIYLLGSIEGHSWATNYDGIAMTKIDKGIYIAYNVPLTASATPTFSFTTQLGSTWEDLNGKARDTGRFGAPNDNEPLEPNTPTHVTRFAGNDTGNCKSWQLSKSGNYDVIVDLYDMTVTVLEAQNAPTVNAWQLFKVQQTAKTDIGLYDFVTYPQTDGTVYGVKADGTLVETTALSKFETKRFQDIKELRATDLALVETRLSPVSGYSIDQKSATYGHKQKDNAFRSIEKITKFDGTEFSSHINYYYTLKQGVDVKIPMHTADAASTVKVVYSPFYMVDANKGEYGNPSYRLDLQDNGNYTLDYARISGADQFYFQSGEITFRPRTQEDDLKPVESNPSLYSDGTSYLQLNGTYLNVVMTLTPENAGQFGFTYTGTLDDSFMVTVGNDKTNQSGTVQPHSDNTKGHITLQTANDDGALIFIYSDEQVHYVLNHSGQNAKRRADDTPKAAGKYTDYGENAYSIGLPLGSGTVTLYKASNLSTPEAVYSYTVTKTTPTEVETITAEEEGEATYFTLQGVKVDNPAHGIYIKVLNGKATKVVL